jgi:hypothetical protein
VKIRTRKELHNIVPPRPGPRIAAQKTISDKPEPVRVYFLVKQEKGSVVLFVAAVVIPILFLLFSLSVDINLYYTASQRAQKVLDDAVLRAHRFLPHQVAAKQILQHHINQNTSDLGSGFSEPSITTTSDMVSVTLKGKSPIAFINWFGSNYSLDFFVYSRARSTPLDVFIAIDTGSNSAPSISEAPWGSTLEWPAAYFFTNELSFSDIDPRVATQQCFNPTLSVLKNSSIKLYDYLSSFQLNNIGLGFYPGFVNDIDIARYVEKGGRREDQSTFPGEASFDSISGAPYANNEYCLAAAERENVHLPYKFPLSNSNFVTGINDNTRPLYRVLPGTRKINQEYLPYLEARDVIWSRAANSLTPYRFNKIIYEIGYSLLAARSNQEREGLVNNANKVAIMVTSDLPLMAQYVQSYKTEMESVFTTLKNEISTSNADVTFIILAFPSEKYIIKDAFGFRGVNSVWDSSVTTVKIFLNDTINHQPAKGKLTAKLVTGLDPEKLVENITALILLEKRTVLLSR